MIGGRDGEATSVVRVENAAASPLRYEMDPQGQFDALKQIEGAGGELIGIEERKGRPSVVRATEDTDKEGHVEGGILRVDFQDPDDALDDIDWDEFFQIFDESNLAFLHQDETKDGKPSRFFKFVHREE